MSRNAEDLTTNYVTIALGSDGQIGRFGPGLFPFHLLPGCFRVAASSRARRNGDTCWLGEGQLSIAKRPNWTFDLNVAT